MEALIAGEAICWVCAWFNTNRTVHIGNAFSADGADRACAGVVENFCRLVEARCDSYRRVGPDALTGSRSDAKTHSRRHRAATEFLSSFGSRALLPTGDFGDLRQFLPGNPPSPWKVR